MKIAGLHVGNIGWIFEDFHQSLHRSAIVSWEIRGFGLSCNYILSLPELNIPRSSSYACPLLSAVKSTYCSLFDDVCKSTAIFNLNKLKYTPDFPTGHQWLTQLTATLSVFWLRDVRYTTLSHDSEDIVGKIHQWSIDTYPSFFFFLQLVTLHCWSSILV